MRYCLLLLMIFTISCTQSAGGGGRKPSSTSPTGSTTGGSTTGGSSSSSSGTTAIKAVSMRYASPAWPASNNAHFYFVPSFSDLANKETSRELASQTSTKDTKMPVMPIKYSDATNGKNFCFSNEEWINEDSGARYFPSCVKAGSNVVSHIKTVQDSNSGLHSVFINAIQFNFKNAPESAGGYYSQVYFENAYVEKAKISFDETSGNPIVSEKFRYNYGSGECNLDDQDAVGFEVDNQGTNRFFLSGIASFERAKKKVFGEGTQENRVYEATECSSGSGEFLCNLIADKVSVWHAMFVPVIYKNNNTGNLRLSHRQFASQVVSNGRLTGSKGSSLSNFGYYANSTNLGNVVSTPIMGKVDRDGNQIANWEQSFITGFCLKGRRKEKLGWTSLVKAMYFELKSPRIKKITGSN